MPSVDVLTTPARKAAESVAAAVFGAAAAVRPAGKPLHPRGVLLDGVLARQGCAEPAELWGSAWLDEPGDDICLVRLSRSAGLPSPLPDVGGLTLRVPGEGDRPADLLLATAGTAPLARHLLVPRRHAARPYTSLVPYLSPRGPVMLGAFPDGARSRLTLDEEQVAAAVGRSPLTFRLMAASPRGPWQPFATLRITGRAAGELDPSVSFDPVVFPLPGLRLPGPLAGVRAAAYAGARHGSGRRLQSS